MDMDPKDFLDVPLNQNAPHACSPPLPALDWMGLVVRAPRRVEFTQGESIGDYHAFAAIPICGYYRVALRFEGPNDPMKLVAVDKKSGQVFSGPIVELDPSPDAPPPVVTAVPDPARLKNTKSGGYFNPNLADYVNLPHASATYDVHVEFREHKSNVVTIELVERH